MIDRKDYLVGKLARASKDYYSTGRSDYTDQEFDALLEELREIDSDHPFLKQVGAKIERGNKFTHRRRMYSLEKVKDEEEFKKWASKFPDNTIYCLSLKLDGAALALYYEQGCLVKAVTRGDGTEGEVVTAKALRIKNIPNTIPMGNSLQVTGECIIKDADFKRYEAEGYTNARNLAAGTLNQDDLSLIAKRNLKFFAYNCNNLDLKIQGHLSERFKNLNKWGFDVVNYMVTDLVGVIQEYKEASEERGTLTFQIDGLCAFIDHELTQSELGYTGHHPRFAVALKFPSESVITEVLDIEWSVGRTGAVTPVAILKPVECGGATISRVSLHNADIMRSSSIGKGSMILLKRSNDVIPYVEKVLNKVEVVLLNECPACAAELIWDGPRLVCPDLDCPAQLKERIEHFLKAFDFKGLSVQSIDKLVERYDVRSFPEFFELSERNYQESLGINNGIKLWRNLRDDISRIPLHKFLAGLGIKLLGKTLSKELAKKIDHNDWLMFFGRAENKRISLGGLMQLGLGPTQAEEISKGLNNFVDNEWPRLRELGFVVHFKPIVRKENAMKFVITGKLEQPRKVYENMIERRGHTFSKSMTKDTDYLVCGEGGGSKRAKAEKLGIPWLTEESLVKLLGE